MISGGSKALLGKGGGNRRHPVKCPLVDGLQAVASSEVAAFCLAMQVCDLVLLRLLPSLCLSTITYLMVGLVNDNKHFLMFLLIVLLTSSISGTICLVFSAATKDIGKANLCVVMMFAFAMMFGGLLTNSSAEGVAGVSQHHIAMHTRIRNVFYVDGFAYASLKHIIFIVFGMTSVFEVAGTCSSCARQPCEPLTVYAH